MIRHEEVLNFVSPVFLLDTEISNQIFKEDKSIDYPSAKLCTLGILFDNKIIILQKEKTDTEESFYNSCRELLMGKPVMFAFNFNFDKEIISNTLKRNLFMADVKPFRGKNCSVNELAKALEKDKKMNLPEDPLVSGANVENAYAEGRYKDVILHNRADLIKEYYLLMNSFYLREKYKSQIDSNGWYQGEFKV